MEGKDTPEGAENNDVPAVVDEQPKRARARVSTSELDERMQALEQRLSDLDAREADLAAREREFEMRAAVAPRGREEAISTRSRAADESRFRERPDMDTYSPPNQMEMPQDDQYYYRWVRESVNGVHTPASVQKRIKEGFERVRIDELPEDFIVDEDMRGDGHARHSGLLLMRLPKARKEMIDAYYLGKSRERLAGANELQGIASRDYVHEDRGSRSIDGAEAKQLLSRMMQT